MPMGQSKKNIKIVIGANYGDEGKGSCVNHLSKSNSLVIRTNGGPQMGHTVYHDKKKHVFSNFASGTLKGAKTYIAGTAIVNPMTFKKEHRQLVKDGLVPKYYVSENCIVTTPFDMLVNQASEMSLGSNAYGSCGLGIWETVERNKLPKFSFRISDINPNKNGFVKLRVILERIKNDYFKNRLMEMLCGDKIPEPLDEVVDKDLITPYLKDVEYFFANVNVISEDREESFVKSFNNIVFENSQGLLLSQERESLGEHVTPSYTGIKLPKEFIEKYNLDSQYKVSVYYCTRWYMTRHGNGELKNQCTQNALADNIVDETNAPNDFQGSIRFARLDLEELIGRIKKDFGESEWQINLAVSCLGQNLAMLSKQRFGATVYRHPVISCGVKKNLSYNRLTDEFYSLMIANFDNFGNIYQNNLYNFQGIFRV